MKWRTGEYDRLWTQVTSGQQTQCYVQGRYGRDICHIKPDWLEFIARGIGYGGVEHIEKEFRYAHFLDLCVDLKVEWLDYSPDPAEVLVKAIKDVNHKIADINDYVTNDVCFILTAALTEYEQLKDK